MIWAFKCQIIDVDGHLYIKTSERAYHPKDKVKDPEEVVLALQKNTSSTVYCRLLGNNSSEIRRLWVERDKTKD